MGTTRRSFLRMLGISGAVGGLAPSATAWADRMRILGGGGGGSASAEPFSVVRGSAEFQQALGGVRVGDARSHGGLLVLWLHGAPGAPLDVATLEETRSRGDLLLMERDQASVPELIVENRSKSYVLLLAGEILLGGKQHRVLREDILLPPASGPRNIGVYCVEQGRWAGRAKHFEAKGSFAAPGLRSRVMEKADQGRVWAEVDRYAKSLSALSPTRSYQEIYDKREVKEHLADVERGLDHRTALGALGAAVFVGPTMVGLDVFFDAGVFGRQWPKLLRAAALEAYREERPADTNEQRARLRVAEVLQTAAKAEGTLRENAGVGSLFEFRAKGFRGSGLVFDRRVVHAAVL